MQTTILVNVTSEVQSQNLEINSEILKEKNEKEKISSHVSITDPAVLARFLSFEMLSYGMYLLSFGMYSLSFGMYFFSFEIFFQEIHIRALDNSGTHDTTHKQTSRTSIRWDKLRCNCSSRKKKRYSSNLKIPLKIKNKNKFLRTSIGMHFSSFGTQFSSFEIHFLSFVIFQKLYMPALKCSGTHDTSQKQTSHTSIRCDKLRCNHSSKKEKRLALKLEKPLKTINKCKFLRNFSYMMYTKIFLNKKALFSFETKSLMQKCFRILSYIISATKYTMSFSND